MGYMFSGCLSLTSIPDISNWKVNKVNNMLKIFSNCPSLSFLPNLSNWDCKKINLKSNDNNFISLICEFP